MSVNTVKKMDHFLVGLVLFVCLLIVVSIVLPSLSLYLFLFIIIGISSAAIFLRRFPTGYSTVFRGKFCALAPNFVVSLGVLGTFVGIASGLYGFDSTAIEKSVPTLLDGLKTAFYTSIGGMAASLLLKSVYAIIDNWERVDGESEVGEDPVEILHAIRQSIVDSNQSICEKLQSNSESFVSEFRHFAGEVTEQSHASLTKALEKVMSQFNAAIGHLAAKAFEELQASIEQLNSWQIKHYSQLSEFIQIHESLVEQSKKQVHLLQQSSQTICQLEPTFKSIASSIEIITCETKDLQDVSDRLKDQTLVMKETLARIAELGSAAKETMPLLENKWRLFLDGFEETIGRHKQAIHFIMLDLEQGTKDIRTARREQNRLMNEAINDLKQLLNETWGTSMDTMVEALTKVSMKFASDYTPLAERLRDVLAIAEESQHIHSRSDR